MMKNTMKLIGWILLTILGFLLYVCLYFLVVYVNKYPFFKHLIVVIGYISIIIFPLGFYNLIKQIRQIMHNKQ